MADLSAFLKAEGSKSSTGNNGAYIDLVPAIPDLDPNAGITRLLGKGLTTRLEQAGLSKGERAAVSKAIGNVAYLVVHVPEYRSHNLTVQDVRDATIEELACLPDSGRRTARILKKLVGE